MASMVAAKPKRQSSIARPRSYLRVSIGDTVAESFSVLLTVSVSFSFDWFRHDRGIFYKIRGANVNHTF